MNKVWIALVLLHTLFNISCKAQNLKRMTYPTVTESLEKADSLVFDDDQQTKKTITLPDGTEMRYVRVKAGISLRIVSPQSPYAVVKNYYPDGFIREKGVSISANPCPLGTWYFFTQQHSLKERKDFDAGYRFDIEDVLKYIRDENIPLPPRIPPAGSKYTEIFKIEEGGTPVYQIEWLKNPGLIETITLSGKNGSVIRRQLTKYDNS